MKIVDDHVEVTTEEASGGSTPNILRYMLGVSLVLAIVVLTVMWVGKAYGT